MERKRLSKALALDTLDKRASQIAEREKFNRSWGTAQLRPNNCSDAEALRLERAVEYGRMRAFEQFAETIEEGFMFENPSA